MNLVDQRVADQAFEPHVVGLGAVEQDAPGPELGHARGDVAAAQAFFRKSLSRCLPRWPR